MSEKKRFVVFAILLCLSIALLVYLKVHIGHDFVRQLQH